MFQLQVLIVDGVADVPFSHSNMACFINMHDLHKAVKSKVTDLSKSNFEDYLSQLANGCKVPKIASGIMPVISTYLARDDEGEPKYGDVTEDAQGNELHWLTAAALVKVIESYVKEFKLVPRDKAVLAFLKELEPNKQVVLYWD